MNRMKKIALFSLSLFFVFLVSTIFSIKFDYKLFNELDNNIIKYQFLDRNNKPINKTYQNKFNLSNNINIYTTNKRFIQFLIFSEDKNFYNHSGVDWLGRVKALYLNARSMRAKMGASTISEQVTRILHRRKRNLWSKWIEGIEANLLERNVSKNAILEFYINQVPFANNIRGFELAARYYFDRSLDSLSLKEMLFLIVNIRAPSDFNAYKNANFVTINRYINILAQRLYESNLIHRWNWMKLSTKN